MRLTINTKSREQRAEILKLIHLRGYVEDRWKDGSFDFAPTSDEAYEKIIEILEDEGIEYENR